MIYIITYVNQSSNPLNQNAQNENNTMRAYTSSQTALLGSIVILISFELCNRTVIALAGFGKNVNSKARVSSGRSKKKKKKSNLFEDSSIQSTEIKDASSDSNAVQQLDRFGLPIQTADDIFPPLSSEYTLTPCAPNSELSLIDVNNQLDKENCLSIDPEVCEKLGFQVKLLHMSPPVLEIDNFFTADECDEYLKISSESHESHEALMVESPKFSAEALSRRTSTTWFCHYKQVPTLLAKASNLLTKPVEHFEEPQVVRYRTGEEFTWHYDEIPKNQLENGGQRIATMLVYLNSLEKEEGGATIFRDLVDGDREQLKVVPKRGKALIFFPASKDGVPDDRTLHKGEVSKSQKVIAQCWIHERDYKPAVPVGNSHSSAKDAIQDKHDLLFGTI